MVTVRKHEIMSVRKHDIIQQTEKENKWNDPKGKRSNNKKSLIVSLQEKIAKKAVTDSFPNSRQVFAS